MTDISFRWGIPLLDSGFTTIPNHFFRVYSQVISKDEWGFICHLASYKYESAGSECRPSLTTIAKEMGFKDARSVRRLREGLEAKKLLHVTHQSGRPSIYDLTPLSKKLSALTPDRSVHTTPGISVRGPRTDPSTEEEIEEQIDKKNKPPVADSWDSIPEAIEIPTTATRTIGIGKNKRILFRCEICGNEVEFMGVGIKVTCTCGEVFILIKKPQRRKHRVPHGFKDPILEKGATLAFFYSRRETRASGWWTGFKPDQLAIWKGLMLNSHKRAPTNWEKWLVYCKEAGDTGRGLVLHAYNGFKQQGGGPPPKARKAKQEELEIAEEALTF